MPSLFKYENGGSFVTDEYRVAGTFPLSGAVVPPFITKRGDVVSSSHVLQTSTVKLGNTTTMGGLWQVSSGTYQVIFPELWAAGQDLFVSYTLIASGTTAQSGYHAIDTGTSVTGSSPFQLGNVKATCLNVSIISGTNPTAVDPPVDLSLRFFAMLNGSDGTY
jgi:hypothetical protein